MLTEEPINGTCFDYFMYSFSYVIVKLRVSKVSITHSVQHFLVIHSDIYCPGLTKAVCSYYMARGSNLAPFRAFLVQKHQIMLYFHLNVEFLVLATLCASLVCSVYLYSHIHSSY